MRLIADFHVHSRFARACSKYLTLPTMTAWAAVKGIDLMGTADFTHPIWLSEIQQQLKEVGDGIYAVKEPIPLPYPVANPRPVRFVLTHEIATIWSQGGKLRRMHTILIAPNLEAAENLTRELEPRGKLGADGRPILGMSARELAERAWSVDERMLVIPAHAWTPWFAVFGSQSGFDSLEECFGADLVSRIPAIETGMSSNPPMNWRISALDNVALISCSDGHSLDNLGREATVFEVAEPDKLSFDLIARMIWEGAPKRRREMLARVHSGVRPDSPPAERTRARDLDLLRPDREADNSPRVARNSPRNTRANQDLLAYLPDYLAATIEFFPEEGKYHHDGHRVCGVNWTPEERKRHNGICTTCGRPVTVGVLSRVDELADREFGDKPEGAPDFLQIVPIRDIASALFGVGKQSKRIERLYDILVSAVGPEFALLLDAPIATIAKAGGDEFAAIVQAMRAGSVTMIAGYDGVYGKLQLPSNQQTLQHSLFQKELA